MRLENSFTIEAPVDEVWSTMLDFERVASCVPGAEIVGTAPDGGLEATIKVKVGPMTMSYRGIVQIVDQDSEARRAVMDAKARETRGQGSANASMVMQVQDGSPVSVSIVTDLDVTGRVAQMGRGVMQDVAGRIVDDFAGNLQAMMLASRRASPPAPGDRVEAGDEPPPEPAPPPTGAQRGGDALSARDLVLAVLRGRWRALGQWLRRIRR